VSLEDSKQRAKNTISQVARSFGKVHFSRMSFSESGEIYRSCERLGTRDVILQFLSRLKRSAYIRANRLLELINCQCPLYFHSRKVQDDLERSRRHIQTSRADQKIVAGFSKCLQPRKLSHKTTRVPVRSKRRMLVKARSLQHPLLKPVAH